ncbi:cobalamin-independent glycerol dehydratase small subunit [Natranaerovirga hydrolytica]|uniref:Cobalamin-independent glycerol dehydratase small subunit n=1 Tax=Natranaerovirga hydrolytica TaxID=680378 RepID=A0A4R1MDC1_9FIRM|nr:glycyl-radical enzyme activating protein [Natranaerovirga hydrolytica]TCK88029.1 cobalamin-independent glycerol dehydratase small subunit [Natranaerovirga hydrolytica]
MNSSNNKTTGIVFDTQRFSVHDGPGIRTIVFLKGCPLSCLWCCNPESQKMNPILIFQSSKCIGCGRCIGICEQGILKGQKEGFIESEKCIGCGKCIKVCPVDALMLKGQRRTVEDVINELKKDEIHYRRSGGGITISGGEPLSQPNFAIELLKECQSKGWHTAMETTGYAKPEVIESVIPHLDLVLLDIKSMDAEKSKKYTGVSIERIKENAQRIVQLTKTVVRVPTIPGFNATKQEIKEICNFVKTLQGVETIHLLPYHNFGESKYELLGMTYEMKYIEEIPKEEMEALKKVVEEQGFQCMIGG